MVSPLLPIWTQPLRGYRLPVGIDPRPYKANGHEVCDETSPATRQGPATYLLKSHMGRPTSQPVGKRELTHCGIYHINWCRICPLTASEHHFEQKWTDTYQVNSRALSSSFWEGVAICCWKELWAGWIYYRSCQNLISQYHSFEDLKTRKVFTTYIHKSPN